ncbi:MAG: hypothetical protein IPP17_26700 [Bacteroidetes bacterium]|nr:hypothetical protein [Bacteroidota bacterium]
MEEPVIEALLIALEAPRASRPRSCVDIAEEDIQTAVAAFELADINPTYNRLATFLRHACLQNPELIRHPLYGK